MQRRACLFMLAGLLTGCQLLPARPAPARPNAAPIRNFAFNGRLAVRQGEQRHYLKIDWRHDTQTDVVLLTTPLGQGIAEITRTITGAQLVLADKRRFTAEDWSGLAEQAFGFRLPLNAAPRWLLGDIDGAPEGWHIRILERDGEAADALPTLIELERDDLNVRLKIDEWSELQ